MAFPDTVFLHDRIKEISHSTGAGNLSLDGAATGFGSFSGVYSDGDAVFYAITDGTEYEVGSGHYINDGSSDAISRFAFNSSNSNNNVNFSAGIKEIFVSYPGKFALFSAGGMDGFTQPDVSGMAFFGSQQTVDYSSNVIFDKNNSRIGIVQPAPLYSVDVGGAPANSLMRSSGIIVAESGIIFSGVSPTHTSAYSGGIQLEPFMRNELDATTGSNAIFSLSGLVEQRLLLDKQIKGSIFAGPTSGCVGGCSPDYPTFRYLESEDIPSLSHLYTIQFVDSVGNVPHQGDVTFYKESGVLDHDHFFNWDATNNRLGINRSDPSFTLDVDGDGSISGKLDVQKATFLHNNLSVSGNVVVSGNLDVQGDITYIDSSTVTIYDKQLELGSMSGTALYADSALDDAGIAIKSTDYDKKWTWRDSNDSWRTDEGIGASGILEVSGHATFGNDLLVTNNATVSGLFNASGNSTFDGNISAQKKLFVTEDSYFVGATTVSGNLNVSGVSTFNKDTHFTANAPVIMSGTLGVSGNAVFANDVIVSGDLSVSGVATFASGIAVTGIIRTNSGIVGQSLNIQSDPLNYINGSTFFRQNSSDDFSVRINGLGIVPYTNGSAYNGVEGRAFNKSAAHKVMAVSGLNTAQSFVYSTYGVHDNGDVNYQRLGISGSRHGNFEITTQAQGSGLVRPIDFTAPTNFTKDVFFTSNAPVVMSGTLGVSGQTTLNGGLTTYSGGPGVFDPNIVINSSGLLTVPIFNGTAASLATTLPPTTWTSGAIVFVNDPANPKALAVNNGYTWYSGILS